MKGIRALASGLLVLATACAAPAISAAQDTGTTTDAATTDPATTDATTANPATTDAATTDPATTQPADAGPVTTTTGAPPAEASREAAKPTAVTPSGDAVVGTSSAEAQKAASALVTMGDFFFSPSSVTVSVGDTVTWRNSGNAPHNATADDGSFRTPDLNKGQSASHTFNSPGTFSYICTIHPNMHGTVRVLATSSGTGSSGGGGSSGSSSGSSAGTSEASAVASPDAAGTSTTLPMTGMGAGALALVGLALLGMGLIVRGLLPRIRSGGVSIEDRDHHHGLL